MIKKRPPVRTFEEGMEEARSYNGEQHDDHKENYEATLQQANANEIDRDPRTFTQFSKCLETIRAFKKQAAAKDPSIA